jgi:hypothetical protein
MGRIAKYVLPAPEPVHEQQLFAQKLPVEHVVLVDCGQHASMYPVAAIARNASINTFVL